MDTVKFTDRVKKFTQQMKQTQLEEAETAKPEWIEYEKPPLSDSLPAIFADSSAEKSGQEPERRRDVNVQED